MEYIYDETKPKKETKPKAESKPESIEETLRRCRETMAKCAKQRESLAKCGTKIDKVISDIGTVKTKMDRFTAFIQARIIPKLMTMV